jgi:hypothetical protein
MSEANEPMTMEPGRVSWNELIVNNTRAAADFYGKLFGWQAMSYVPQGMPASTPPYTIFRMKVNDVRGVSGMMQPPKPVTESFWLPYVVVANVNESLKKAVKLGAKECVPVTSLGEVGRIAVIKDPQGAIIGLHELPKS